MFLLRGALLQTKAVESGHRKATSFRRGEVACCVSDGLGTAVAEGSFLSIYHNSVSFDLTVRSEAHLVSFSQDIPFCDNLVDVLTRH